MYNEGKMYDAHESARGNYAWLAQEVELGISPVDSRAASCVQCGICDAKCPQQIPISQWMPVVHKVLGENGAYQSTPTM